MLYDRWLQTARDNRKEPALVDQTSGRRWTFAALAQAADSGEPPGDGRFAYPSGNGADFILAVLRGWRLGRVICPLEPGQGRISFSTLPQDCVHLKTSSASTGAARVVAFTAVQLFADAENIVATMGLRPDWPNLGVISMAHSYGFSNLVLPLLCRGIPLFLADSAWPETVRRLSAQTSALTLPAVPALWRAWREAGVLPSNLRLAISAGAPLPLDLERAVFEETGVKIHNFYGATECGGIAYDRTLEPRTDPCAVGAPLENVTVSLNPDGCLQVNSPAAGQTYWPDPSPNLANGRYITTDLAELNREGIFLRGRAGDQIHVAGRKIHPETIERALLSHGAVRDAVVFGAPAEQAERTEQIVACVALRSEVSTDELKQFILRQLPAWQAPRHWWIVDSIQPSSRGKISRADWRRRYIEGKRL